MSPHTHPDWVAEDILATELAVPRSVLQQARNLLPMGDVDKDGPWVVWKKSAASAFAASLGLAWPPPEAAGDSPQKNPPEPEELAIASEPRGDGWHFPNHRIIRARRANGAIVDVQVMDSSKYSTHLRTGTPMIIKAQPSTSGPHWVLVGREPRFKGAW